MRHTASNRHHPPGVAAERFRAGFERRRGQIAALGRRGSQVLLLAGLTGVVTGLAVAGFGWVTRDQLFESLRTLPIGVRVSAPPVGLVRGAAILRWSPRAGSAAASSYVVFAAFAGPARLSAARGARPSTFRALAGAVVLGVICGVGARWFARALVRAKQVAGRANPWVRAAGAGVGLAGLAAASSALFGSALTLGPGYDNLEWAFNPHRAVILVVALLLLRAAATVLTVAGGGAGGLVIPPE